MKIKICKRKRRYILLRIINWELDGKIEASISALSVPDLKYICRKDTTDEKYREFLQIVSPN